MWRVLICKGFISICKGLIIYGLLIGGGIYIIDLVLFLCLCIWCFDGKNFVGIGIR